MEAIEVGDLRDRLLSGRGTGVGERHCALCERELTDGEDFVEVEVDPRGRGSTDSPPLLCRDCYDRLVEEEGISPIRVFKTGPRRTVVFPMEGTEVPGGSD